MSWLKSPSEPGPASLVYSVPINLTRSTVVRARVYAAGAAAGPVVSRTFAALASSGHRVRRGPITLVLLPDGSRAYTRSGTLQNQDPRVLLSTRDGWRLVQLPEELHNTSWVWAGRALENGAG